MTLASLYVLIDPRDGDIRYVGYTVWTLAKRLRFHFYDREVNHRTNWLRKLTQLGLHPIIRLVQQVPCSVVKDAERYWIAFFRLAGCSLVNGTDGGDGFLGRKHTEETKQRLRTMSTGRTLTEEAKAKISQANKGRMRTEEAKERVRQANLGKKASLDARRKMSEAHKGKKHSAETLRKISEAQRSRHASRLVITADDVPAPARP